MDLLGGFIMGPVVVNPRFDRRAAGYLLPSVVCTSEAPKLTHGSDNAGLPAEEDEASTREYSSGALN
jgi:hypothetical protein